MHVLPSTQILYNLILQVYHLIFICEYSYFSHAVRDLKLLINLKHMCFTEANCKTSRKQQQEKTGI